jgi:preprotein translocase SecE subunit
MGSRIKKWVNLTFFSSSVLFSYLLYSFSMQLLSVLHWEARIRNTDMVVQGASAGFGLILFLILVRSQKISQFFYEVFEELMSVSWPKTIETRLATWVVLVLVLCSGVVLGLIDYAWSLAVRQIL